MSRGKEGRQRGRKEGKEKERGRERESKESSLHIIRVTDEWPKQLVLLHMERDSFREQ